MPSQQRKKPIEWDDRAGRDGLHAVFTTRWSKEECANVNAIQQEAIFSLLPNLAGYTILDLGCGIGRLGVSLSPQSKTVIGIDISIGMLRRAQAEVMSIAPNVNLAQASASFLPFPSDYFHVIIASYVLQHILQKEYFENSLREISRTLKSNGSVVIVDALDDHSYLPTNSSVTMIRTFEQYRSFMEPSLHLCEKRYLRCVEDEYTIMLWQKL